MRDITYVNVLHESREERERRLRIDFRLLIAAMALERLKTVTTAEKAQEIARTAYREIMDV